jgi:hypothetical protein
MSGMENAILVMFITGGVYFMVKHRKGDGVTFDIVLSGLFFVLACLTRPEAHLITIYAGGLRLYWIIKDRRISQSDFIWVGVILGLLVPYHIFRLVYFGKLLPNTFYIKGASDFSDIFRIGFGEEGFYLEGRSVRLLLELIVFNLNIVFIVLSTFSIFSHNGNKELRAFYLLIMVSFLIYMFRVGRDMMFYRLYLPALPFQMILAQEGLKNLQRLINRRKSKLIRDDRWGWLGIVQSIMFSVVFLFFLFNFTNVEEIIDISRTGDIRLGAGIFGVVWNFNLSIPLIVLGVLLVLTIITGLLIARCGRRHGYYSKALSITKSVITMIRTLLLLTFLPVFLVSLIAITKGDGSLLTLHPVDACPIWVLIVLFVFILALLFIMYINQQKHNSVNGASIGSMNLHSLLIAFIIIANLAFNLGFALGYGGEFIRLLENSHGKFGRYLNEHAKEEDYVIFQDMGYTPWVARDIRFIDTIGIVNPFMGEVMPEYDYTPFFYHDKIRTEEGKTEAEAFQEVARDYFFSYGKDARWFATVLYTDAHRDKRLKRDLSMVSKEYIQNSNIDPEHFQQPLEEISDKHKARVGSIFAPFNRRNKYYYKLTHDSRFRQRYELVTYWRGSYSFWVVLYRFREDWQADIVQSELLLGDEFMLDLLPNAVINTDGLEVFYQKEMYLFSDEFESYDQLLFIETDKGDSVDLGLNIEDGGQYKLNLGMIEGKDFGKVRIELNRKALSEIDFYNSRIKRKEIMFDNVYFKTGRNTLSFVITGKNTQAIDYRIGIDTIEAEKH